MELSNFIKLVMEAVKEAGGAGYVSFEVSVCQYSCSKVFICVDDRKVATLKFDVRIA